MEINNKRINEYSIYYWIHSGFKFLDISIQYWTNEILIYKSDKYASIRFGMISIIFETGENFVKMYER